MKKDKVERPYKLAVLRDRGGDLSKEWYIEFYAFDESIDDLKRKRVKIPLIYTSDESRRKFAAKEIDDYNKLLRSGFYFKDESEFTPVKSTGVALMLLESLKAMLDNSIHLRKKSLGTYRSALNKLTLTLDEDIPFEALTPAMVYRIRDKYSQNGNNAVTANKNIGLIAMLYREFAKRHDISNDPFKGIKRVPETQKSTTNLAFTKEDQQVLEKYLKEFNYPLYLFTRYMYYAFIRPRELRQLKVRHVYLKGATITIPGEIAKNRKTETVAIIPSLAALVDLKSFSPDSFLFGAGLVPAGGQCSENTPLNWHTQALKECGLKGKGYTLYSWKHTGAVNAYLSGVGIKQLQLLLRHSTVQMTDIYLKSLGLRTDPNIENYNW